MNTTIYIGLDNGASGSIGILGLPSGPKYLKPPTKTEQSYTKAAQNITRIDFPAFKYLLEQEVLREAFSITTREVSVRIHAVLERPFVNPGMFKTTINAVRALEAEVIALEQLGISYEYTDSRAWQKVLLPEGLKGAPVLKKASLDIGLRLFPGLAAEIRKQKDADGLLIAEWARRDNR